MHLGVKLARLSSKWQPGIASKVSGGFIYRSTKQQVPNAIELQKVGTRNSHYCCSSSRVNTTNNANILPHNSIRDTNESDEGIKPQQKSFGEQLVSLKKLSSTIKVKSPTSSALESCREEASKKNSGLRICYSLQPVLLTTFINNNKLIQQKQESKMLLNVFTKFMSTLGNNKSSGVPIESDDQESLLSNRKGNKKIKVNACGELYAELRKTKPSLFGKAPENRGIDFEIHYYDSLELLKPEQRSQAPTICMLHGAPGHYKDFSSTINYFTAINYRVIAPNFPEYSATFKHSFRHSPRERLEFLLKFFQAIQIKQIDMLIGHSSAVYTMFELLDHSVNSSDVSRKVTVRSIGLFSTPTYNLPSNMAVTPFRMFTLKLFDYTLLRPIIVVLIHTFVKLQGIQNRVDRDKIDHLLIAASAVGYSDSDKVVGQLKILREHKVPTFVLIGCNDRLIPMKCFEQLKNDLGIKNDKQVKHYNTNGEVERDVEYTDELVEVSEFNSGGHYTFQKFSRQVNEDIHNFLKRKVLTKEYGRETTRL